MSFTPRLIDRTIALIRYHLNLSIKMRTPENVTFFKNLSDCFLGMSTEILPCQIWPDAAGSESTEGPTSSNPACKCPELWPEVSKIPAIAKIPVIREIRPQISETRLENLEIRRKFPEILEIPCEIPGIGPETLQIRPEIPKICPEIHETRL